MKKKLLFIMPSLAAGGGERSLINLLSYIDYEQYEVDLYLMSHEGIFLELLPEEVHLLPLSEVYRRFSQPIGRSVAGLLKQGELSLALNRMLFSLNNRTGRNVSVKEQAGWKYVSPTLRKLQQEYDAAIGYLEKSSIYFCVDKVKAKKKIGWIHSDYDQLGMDAQFDQFYFRELDHIVTVSDECAKVLCNRFPEEAHKVTVIYNMVSPGMIRAMADAADEDLFNRQAGETILLSIGRLQPEKGFLLAVEAFRILLERGYKVKWHIIGEGDEREALQHKIEEYGLSDRFKLLGVKSNPYPYLAQADIYVQPSRFEGKSIAIDEAKILQKPIVITSFSTADDQLRRDEEGLIADMSAESVAASIAQLIDDPALGQRFKQRLAALDLGTEKEVYKFYTFLQGGDRR